MMGVAKDEPDQSAQPDVFCSPPWKVGAMYTPRTASGNPFASIDPKPSPPKVAIPVFSGGMLAALAKTEGTKRLFTDVTLSVVSYRAGARGGRGASPSLLALNESLPAAATISAP